MSESFLDGRVIMHPGDCLDVLTRLEECTVDSCVTDPPYHLTSIVKRFGSETAAPPLEYEAYAHKGANPYKRVSTGFMGKQWDGGNVAFRPELWREVYRVLKPGAHLLAFGGTRTYHRMTCAIEDAGFEIRDCIQWLYGSGFPKSHDVSKGIDRAAGSEREVLRTVKKTPYSTSDTNDGWKRPSHNADADPEIRNKMDITGPSTASARQWEGWGTALKPACEPIVLARKPLSESTVAANVLKWGTGAINVGACRVATDENLNGGGYDPLGNSRKDLGNATSYATKPIAVEFVQPQGRWPANVMHDGSEEVVGVFPESESTRSVVTSTPGKIFGNGAGLPSHTGEYGFNDSGSAARFFYTAKADSDDRLGSKHPTVKPLDLMQYLVRLITPPKGLVIDPFAGTGTTGEAAFRDGMSAVLIEREAEYQDDIRRRMKLVLGGPDERANAASKQRMKDKPADHGPLFGSVWDKMWAVPFDFSKEPKPEAAE